ncbi:DUF4262 domain-containing protein [Streptomyces sp. NPDC006967]|uniref:DUF4262 domain-containing protein n=1 Tax=Streptomyces sp. NPDC006967 TaxID=3156906 RepID=UPI0033F3BB3A
MKGIPVNAPQEPEGSSIQRKIREDIASQGWSLIWVFDPDVTVPPFAYTVGLEWEFGHPEVVVVGLPEAVSEGVLNAVHAELAEGSRYGDGETSTEILDGCAVKFRAIRPDLAAANLVQAEVFNRGSKFEAVQLMWPDKFGNYPDSQGAPAWLGERQALAP